MMQTSLPATQKQKSSSSPMPEQLSNELAAARLRAAISEVSSAPGAIRIDVHNGYAVLSGPVLENEREIIMSAANNHAEGLQIVDFLEEQKNHNQALGIKASSAMGAKNRLKLKPWPLVGVALAGAATFLMFRKQSPWSTLH